LFSISLISEISNQYVTTLEDVAGHVAVALTQVESSSTGQLADPLQQPWRDLLSTLVDSLLDALLDSEFHRLLDDIANRLVLRRDGHGQQSAERFREGQARS
jgi:hypothetical protein